MCEIAHILCDFAHILEKLKVKNRNHLKFSTLSMASNFEKNKNVCDFAHS